MAKAIACYEKLDFDEEDFDKEDSIHPPQKRLKPLRESKDSLRYSACWWGSKIYSKAMESSTLALTPNLYLIEM